MPVQPLPKEIEGEGDSATEMNGEEESEDERSASQSESEEESSGIWWDWLLNQIKIVHFASPPPPEMNDEDYERRRAECVDEMLDLEKQFSEIKEKLFKERLNQVKAKLEDVMSGKATEYLDPLAVLQNHMQIQIEVAGVYRGLCLEVIKHRHGCELQGAQQHLESEKVLLFDSLEERLLERIQRLEDDRHSVGLTSEWWDGKLRPKHSSKEWDSLWPSKRKKPPLVSGPYIVYMLHDIDIMEDWTAIKKAKAAVSPSKRKLEGL
ncbi:breast cancer metastasis-suppressor 1 isoform X3 [Pituophis catenifer annectens]|uniref:breast cancer metastasis-suppressor 1 isoform X3 n=1 Tax=Pituophis catenifer annectens TaxID=94852 RepID=UPI0039911836